MLTLHEATVIYGVLMEFGPLYRGRLGLLRAYKDGLITESEYADIKAYANNPGHWYHILVWSV